MRESWLSKKAIEIREYLSGQPVFRAAQIWEWIHRRRIADFAEMKNLPSTLRSELADRFTLREFSEREHLISADHDTEKWLYLSGDAAVETALIREQHDKRRTLCVSCMSGCPLGCVFCATGQGGWRRNLSAAEIVEQIYRADIYCEKIDGAGLTNLVLMGMGEPLLNYDAVMDALAIIGDENGRNFGSRRITISTVGIPERIVQLAKDFPSLKLAFSLHAPNQDLRETLIPSAKNYPLPEIISALKKFALRTSRPLTVEYCLLAGINDSPVHARAVDQLLRDLPAKINVIPYNPIRVVAKKNSSLDAVAASVHNPTILELRTPSASTIRAFMSALRTPATLRAEKGRDIGAACGQLRGNFTTTETIMDTTDAMDTGDDVLA